MEENLKLHNLLGALLTTTEDPMCFVEADEALVTLRSDFFPFEKQDDEFFSIFDKESQSTVSKILKDRLTQWKGPLKVHVVNEKDDGEQRVVEVNVRMNLVQNFDVYCVLFRMNDEISDITWGKQSQHEKSLQYRQAILDATEFATESFLSNANMKWESFIEDVLRRVGQITEVSRVYIFKNHTSKDGQLLTTQLFEWCNEGVVPFQGAPEVTDSPALMHEARRWATVMMERRAIYGVLDMFPPEERAFLSIQGILSLLTVPIFVHDQWWGFLGFDDCEKEHVWTPFEVQALLVVAKILGAAIGKESIEKVRAEARVAESTSKARSEFLANMSHEVRTPMVGILGMAEYLESTVLDGDQAECVQTILSCSEHLLGLLNDVLDISKFEAGKMLLERQEFNIAEACEDVVEMFAHKFAASPVNLLFRLVPKMQVMYYGDLKRIKQIVSNLVNNAMKFTKEGHVIVRLYPDDASGRVCIEVEDTGIGIPESKMDSVFEKFVQVEGAHSREYQGTGLGLSIVKSFVETMGGDVTLTSRFGKGTTFKVSLPLEKIPLIPEYIEQVERQIEYVRALVVGIVGNADPFVKEYLTEIGCTVETLDEERSTPDVHIDVLIVNSIANHPEKSKIKWKSAVNAVDAFIFDGIFTVGKPVVLWFMPPQAMTKVKRIKDHFPQVGNVFMRKPAQFSKLLSQIQDLKKTGGLVVPRSIRRGSVSTEKHHSVLLVEDNFINQRVGKRMLSNLRCNVDLASSGFEALEAASKKRYDIVFMDCQMPGMDGYEATQKIREMEAKEGMPRVPIIALTAHAMESDKIRCLECGMDEYLAKPTTAANLEKAIAKFSEQRE